MTHNGHAQQGGRAVRPGHRARGSQHPAAIIDIGGLEGGLRQAVAGAVRFDTASKAMYANDGSNFRQVRSAWSSRRRWTRSSPPIGCARASARPS